MIHCNAIIMEKGKGLQKKSWAPSLGFAFRSLLVVRLCSVFFMHISDCDETYNYWEPVSEILKLL